MVTGVKMMLGRVHPRDVWLAQRGSAGVSMHQGRPEYVSRQYMCMCIWRVHSLDVRCSAGVSMCVAVQA